MNTGMLSTILLLVAGLVNAVPPIGKTLTEATGGTPVIQILVGVACILVALATFVKKYATQ
ncbi:MAG: hypothetical protein WC956_01535 [bacterium]